MAKAKTRAKFYVESRTEVTDGYRVTFRAVTATSDENAKFFKYTPSGTLEMGLVQKEVAENFVPGEYYYLDFVKADA